MDERRMAVAMQFRRAIELLVRSTPLSEAESLEVAEFYEPWAAGRVYEAGRVLKHGTDGGGKAALYTVLQSHTSQEDWQPNFTSALYKPLGFDGGIPLWVQPLGAADAYAKGDTVSHKGSAWVSDTDANIWEPGVWGWHRRE
jgi:hypothetical protein